MLTQRSNIRYEEIYLRAKRLKELVIDKTTQDQVNKFELRVRELEQEVTRQDSVIADMAEETKEAIRQLSFTIELRLTFIKHKRHGGRSTHMVFCASSLREKPPRWSSQEDLTSLYSPNHFETVSNPLPSPVKKCPLGPA
ncbi:hypothetical protein TSUD_244410 [Trifolium subterraneum]|uniref:Uncharacterized protein n=1 Tax=Trifolium subterraneum TaxID=3900 RepID=A0A2Z6PI40_TRISU|nr:hypothetical protein TSUD_244410 [Trifolium subterraneum]